MEVVALDRDCLKVNIGDLDTFLVPVLVVWCLNDKSGLGWVAEMSSTIVRILVRDFPLQLMEIKLKSRYSILFHLDAPGGQ